MEIYSALKAAWHTQEIEALREGRKIVPRHVYLIVSDLCNQDCHFCTYRSSNGWGSENFGADMGKGFTMNPNRMIPREKCIEIITDCAAMGVRAIQFTGGGEPTVHPDLEEIVSFALNCGLQVGLISNGTKLLSTRTLERMSWIRISIDAGNRRTYETTRRSKLWDKVMANLGVLSQIAGPVVGANFVVTKENYREVPQFCVLAKTIGLRYVKIAANLTTEGLPYYDGILDEVMEVMREAKSHATPGFKIISVFERRLEDLRIGRPTQQFCGQQQFVGYIGGDLKVYRCCNTAYTRHGEIGDISQQSYRDWLKSYSFDGFDARSCNHCQFIEKNEATAYMVQHRPEHVEFV